MARNGGEHQGGATVVVARVDVGAAFDEAARELECARLRRRHERGLAMREPRARIRARAEQRDRAGNIAALERCTERFVDVAGGGCKRAGGKRDDRQHPADDGWEGAPHVRATESSTVHHGAGCRAEKRPARVVAGR